MIVLNLDDRDVVAVRTQIEVKHAARTVARRSLLIIERTDDRRIGRKRRQMLPHQRLRSAENEKDVTRSLDLIAIGR